jgi:hypothetical protein
MISTLLALDIKASFVNGNLSSLIDYFQQAGALNALLLGVFGTTAWFFNKYYSFQYWKYTKDTETIEYLVAVLTEIKLNTNSFARNFTDESRDQAKANASAMEAAGERGAMITGEAGENAVYDSLKSKITVLPTDLVEPVVAYYNLEAEFSASYSSLSNPALAKRPVDLTLEMIETTHEDAIACINQGKLTQVAIREKIIYLEERKLNLIVIHTLISLFIVAVFIGKVTW